MQFGGSLTQLTGNGTADMKHILFLFVLTASYGYAQTPMTNVRRDSVPEERGRIFPPDLMPSVRTDNSFYRYPTDPKTVMRASLDNMPVKVADSATNYTMLRSSQKLLKPDEPPMQFLKPIPPVLPKNWKKDR